MRTVATPMLLALGLDAQGLTAAQKAHVDALARQALAQLGAPNASVAVVAARRVEISVHQQPEGKYEQFLVFPHT